MTVQSDRPFGRRSFRLGRTSIFRAEYSPSYRAATLCQLKPIRRILVSGMFGSPESTYSSLADEDWACR